MGSPYQQVMLARMGKSPWCIDYIQITGNTLEIRGWAVPPDGDPERAVFLLNGKPLEGVHYPLPRSDIGQFFWFAPGADKSGLLCQTELPKINENILEPYVFSYVDKATGKPVNPLHNYYYYYTPKDDYVIPPGFNRRRVHGGEEESAFRLEGYSTFIKLREVLKQQFGRDYSDFRSILDWGCGCGRMARYFHWLDNVQVSGIDIDADNIAWCRQNLDLFKRLEVVNLMPPTPLEPDQFDLLIGISIFTHLLERETEEWLGELKRIAAPGAILLMTILSDSTVSRCNMPESMWLQWQQTGFLDFGANLDLESVMQVQDYYRNTFFTHEYVRKNWSKHFEIVEIVPGYIGNHQDLVVMRKV